GSECRDDGEADAREDGDDDRNDDRDEDADDDGGHDRDDGGDHDGRHRDARDQASCPTVAANEGDAGVAACRSRVSSRYHLDDRWPRLRSWRATARISIPFRRSDLLDFLMPT